MRRCDIYDHTTQYYNGCDRSPYDYALHVDHLEALHDGDSGEYLYDPVCHFILRRPDDDADDTERWHYDGAQRPNDVDRAMPV